MFAERKETRKLKREIQALKKKQVSTLVLLASVPRDERDRRLELQRDLRDKSRSIDQMEWQLLKEKAKRLGVEFPSMRDKASWWDNDFEEGMPEYAVSYWPNEAGKFGLRKMIKDEQKKNFEWWFTKIILLLSFIIALVSVTRK